MDILMAANPRNYRTQISSYKTIFLPIQEFWKKENLVQEHDAVLWQVFHTHGKYMKIAQKASYGVIAVDTKGRYLGSALIIESGKKWLIEYVMTNPKQEGKGVGSAVMNCMMKYAKKQNIQFVILNCDPKKNNGQLPAFYGRFGFKKVY